MGKEFLVGCNYWASNAGAFMWKNFDAEVVERDIEFFSRYGINCIRIFPTWDDFQPLKRNPLPKSPTFDKYPFTMRVDEKPSLMWDYESGLHPERLADFKILLDILQKNDMKVIVSFVTGWMSGRRFVPDAFLERDLVSDPEVVLWQCRFIADMIGEIKDYDNIIAWEPGNECNCLTTSATEYECELWMKTITDTIRLSDPTRPVYSGMHTTRVQGGWNLPSQSRYFDAVTTHPYPLFTPYCATEEIRSMRATLHSAVESAYYESITGKPCLAEEVGTLGMCIISDDYAGEFLESAFASTLSVGATGFLWWSSFDQEFDFAPYDLNTLERGLGLASATRKAKPTLETLKDMSNVAKKIGRLPIPDADGVVVLPFYNDPWKSAYGASLMAIQGGRRLEFVYEEQCIKDSGYYILPCVQLPGALSIYQLHELERRVSDGANLLITYNGGGIADFEKLTGLKIAGRIGVPITKELCLENKEISIPTKASLKLVSYTADVLLRDADGEIFMSRNRYGKGSVCFVNAPIEELYSETHEAENTSLYEIYNIFFSDKKKLISIGSSKCMITLHSLDNGNLGVMINNFDNKKVFSIGIAKTLELVSSEYADVCGEELIMHKNYAYLEFKRLNNED